MEVNYQDKKFHNIGPWWQTYTAVIYRGNLTLENAENQLSIFRRLPKNDKFIIFTPAVNSTLVYYFGSD